VAYSSGNTAGREAIARARGFPVAYRRAGKLYVPKSAFQQYRTVAAAHPRDGRISALRSLGNSGQEAVYTRSEGQLRQAFARAARNDLKVFARVTTLRNPHDESHPKTWPTEDVELWERGGWDGEAAFEAIDDEGQGVAFGMIYEQLTIKRALTGSDFGPILDVLLRAVAA